MVLRPPPISLAESMRVRRLTGAEVTRLTGVSAMAVSRARRGQRMGVENARKIREHLPEVDLELLLYGPNGAGA